MTNFPSRNTRQFHKFQTRIFDNFVYCEYILLHFNEKSNCLFATVCEQSDVDDISFEWAKQTGSAHILRGNKHPNRSAFHFCTTRKISKVKKKKKQNALLKNATFLVAKKNYSDINLQPN